MILAGVDIETTGTDPDCNHRIIQIGIYIPSHNVELSYDTQPEGDIVIDRNAMAVNKFTLARIGKATITPLVDYWIRDKLLAAGIKEDSLIAVGWSVGAFDMQFIKQEMLQTMDFFTRKGRRVLDLTALAMLYADLSGIPFNAVKNQIHAEVVKRFRTDKQHDALWDAQAAIESYNILRDWFTLRNYN